MAPKSTKGKAKDAGASGPPESALAAQRTQLAYFPSTIDAIELREAFKPLWGVKTGGEETGHPATRLKSVSFLRRLLLLRALSPLL